MTTKLDDLYNNLLDENRRLRASRFRLQLAVLLLGCSVILYNILWTVLIWKGVP